MTKEADKEEFIAFVHLLYNARVHYHHGRGHGSMQTGMVLQQQLSAYILIHNVGGIGLVCTK